MLHSLYFEVFVCCTLFFALSSGYTLPLLHFYHIPLFPCFDFSFILRFLRAALFYVALFSCCNLFVFLSFLVALFSCCFFVLHSFNVILSSCCTIFMLKCYLFSEQVFRKKLRCDCFFFICCVKSAIWKFY